MKDFHGQKKGNCCDQHGGKMTVDTTEFPLSQLFVYLKRYDTDKSTLNTPTEAFSSFVRKVSSLTHYCLNKYLSHGGVMNSIAAAVKENTESPQFCTEEMKQKVILQIIRTILNYKLKWQNDTIKEEAAKSKASKRKLKILKHE